MGSTRTTRPSPGRRHCWYPTGAPFAPLAPTRSGSVPHPPSDLRGVHGGPGRFPGMRCEVLAIGTELLLGQIVDTNSAWIGERLAEYGIDSYEHRVVGDNQTRIVHAIHDLLSRSDTLIICGGLGPTQDDLTRDAIAEVMAVELVRDHALVEQIAAMFRARVRDMPENNQRQADIPMGGAAIENPIGTAPVCAANTTAR